MPPSQWWISAQVKPKRTSRPNHEPNTASTVAKASGPLAAASSHQASRSMPKKSAAPVMRCTIDMTMVIRGRKMERCGESGRAAFELVSVMLCSAETHIAAHTRGKGRGASISR
jgi:hypothetical protein